MSFRCERAYLLAARNSEESKGEKSSSGKHDTSLYVCVEVVVWNCVGRMRT